MSGELKNGLWLTSTSVERASLDRLPKTSQIHSDQQTLDHAAALQEVRFHVPVQRARGIGR
jgi:hypothetical protein